MTMSYTVRMQQKRDLGAARQEVARQKLPCQEKLGGNEASNRGDWGGVR